MDPWSIVDSAWWGETTEWRIRHIYSAYEPALGAWGYRWIIWLSSSPSWLLSWQLCSGFITTSFFSGTVLWKGSVSSLADVDTFMISFYFCHRLSVWTAHCALWVCRCVFSVFGLRVCRLYINVIRFELRRQNFVNISIGADLSLQQLWSSSSQCRQVVQLRKILLQSREG